MTTDTLDLRDQFAMAAPITYEHARTLWLDAHHGSAGPNMRNGTERRAFMALWASMRYEWADVMMEQSFEQPHEPGQPLPPTAEDRRLDRQLITLDFWDYRVTKPLAAAGITTLRQLLALDIYQLDAIKGIGPDGLRDVIDRLQRERLHLTPHTEPAPLADHDPAPVMGDDAIGA